ncbi:MULTISPECIES: hypothetical protein [Streptomyces]|uniref:HNH endonuclease n=1 Tax=Streptomyces doudnae TaxID=3075536 RepID=A0ABD5EMA1_9ACTN|nr:MULTISPECIES: hypothetical protein [unclassified Streptomyces]MDT0435194.1 hypothetical protein [Streptomyces sp. DSM 41981]MYQ65417.1 hypothetical protein [Streptomyces sp. SID4950]SCD99172.1 hypothetical protein GA0115242_118893 [Streptomyces sp. SolWspMP-5a-2]
MALETIICVIAVCDLCGRRNTDSEYGAHYPTRDDAFADLTTAYGSDPAWALTADGRLICDRRDQRHHEQRIPVHGWHPTSGAMTVTFAPDTPPHPAHP